MLGKLFSLIPLPYRILAVVVIVGAIFGAGVTAGFKYKDARALVAKQNFEERETKLRLDLEDQKRKTKEAKDAATKAIKQIPDDGCLDRVTPEPVRQQLRDLQHRRA